MDRSPESDSLWFLESQTSQLEPLGGRQAQPRGQRKQAKEVSKPIYSYLLNVDTRPDSGLTKHGNIINEKLYDD